MESLESRKGLDMASIYPLPVLSTSCLFWGSLTPTLTPSGESQEIPRLPSAVYQCFRNRATPELGSWDANHALEFEE